MLKDSNALRGEWKMCRVKAVYPDEHGTVRNVMVTVPPPSLASTKEYPKSLAMNDLKRHVSNLIVIVPSEDLYKYENEIEKLAIAGECEADQLSENIAAADLQQTD